ncbi:dihydrofolate reductase family protein [Leifsonia sp. C5G2]|uniref:dihydrofolate reductase family protein n=1 Tax=Leifsonia sp. C5G2 TaxID=2735269 RepID=UPI0015857F76|nr:dihydrofolate reductase family protein [Leifsonia sp. C5G2]NUU05251.1 deaminase [Leifsonia sp. C5G2]
MGRLIYPTNVSLDGYIEDESGGFTFYPIDEEVFAVHTELMRSTSLHLYGRRLYENMAVWETDTDLAAQSPAFSAFSAAWQAPEKIVFSTTLAAATTARTRIEHEFVPAAVRALKAAAGGDLIIGGADLAAQAFEAGLIDEVQLYVLPVILGGGKPGLPRGVRSDLELVEARQLGRGVVRLRYTVPADS